MRQESLDAGMHDKAAIGDLVGVAAAQEPAAAKLADLKIALRPPAVSPVVEFDQSVDHGLLRGGIVLPLRPVRRQEHRAVGGERNLLQVVDEFLEGQLRLRRRPRRDEAVDHQHGAAPPLDLPPGKVGERLQPALAHVAKGAEIGQLVRDKRLVEKRHPPQVLHHARVVLGEERHIQGASALSPNVVEADLVAEDGLARPRRTLDDVDAAPHEPAAQDRVEAGHATRHPLQHRRGNLP